MRESVSIDELLNIDILAYREVMICCLNFFLLTSSLYSLIVKLLRFGKTVDILMRVITLIHMALEC